MTPFETESYHSQLQGWPTSGKHIMAHYDDESIVVYQAYNPAIADFAVTNQRFGGPFSFSRMSWIKSNIKSFSKKLIFVFHWIDLIR